MSWLRFDDLSPEQADAARQHMIGHVENIAKLRRPESREYLIQDGALIGSRPIYTAKDRELVAALTGDGIRSKTDLREWKPMPAPFHTSNR